MEEARVSLNFVYGQTYAISIYSWTSYMWAVCFGRIIVWTTTLVKTLVVDIFRRVCWVEIDLVPIHIRRCVRTVCLRKSLICGASTGKEIEEGCGNKKNAKTAQRDTSYCSGRENRMMTLKHKIWGRRWYWFSFVIPELIRRFFCVVCFENSIWDARLRVAFCMELRFSASTRANPLILTGLITPIIWNPRHESLCVQ